MRTLSVEPSFSSSTVNVRISNAYLNLGFNDFLNETWHSKIKLDF